MAMQAVFCRSEDVQIYMLPSLKLPVDVRTTEDGTLHEPKQTCDRRHHDRFESAADIHAHAQVRIAHRSEHHTTHFRVNRDTSVSFTLGPFHLKQ